MNYPRSTSSALVGRGLKLLDIGSKIELISDGCLGFFFRLFASVTLGVSLKLLHDLLLALHLLQCLESFLFDKLISLLLFLACVLHLDFG